MTTFSLLLVFLTGGELLTSWAGAPPTDLASFLEPVPALQRMEVDVEEEGLIDVISVPPEAEMQQAFANLSSDDHVAREQAGRTIRQAGEAARPMLERKAASDDAEVAAAAGTLLEELNDGALYTKRILAVRALEQMESHRALPALKDLAEHARGTQQPTLAAAALDAVSVINRGEPLRPAGQKVLKDLCQHLPPEVRVCILAEMVTGARPFRFSSIIEMQREFFKSSEPLLANAGLTHEQAVERLKDVEEHDLIKTVSAIGNLRIDALAVLYSDSWAAKTKDLSGWVWIVKGLYEPARVQRLPPGEHMRDVQGVPVLPGGGFALALVDEHTIVMIFGGESEESTVELMGRVLSSLRGGPETGMSPAVEDALSQFQRDDVEEVRAAMAGHMMLNSKAKLRRDLQTRMDSIEPDEPDWPSVHKAALKLLHSSLDLHSFTGYMTHSGDIMIEAQANDARKAAAVETDLQELDHAVLRMAERVCRAQWLKPVFYHLRESALETEQRDGEIHVEVSLGQLWERYMMVICVESKMFMAD